MRAGGTRARARGGAGIDVLHVTLMRADGGGPAYVADLVAAQLADGRTVAAAVPEGSYITTLLPAAAPTVLLSMSLRPRGLLRSVLTVRRAVREHKPRVVHAHSAYGGAVARVALATVPRRAGRPISVFQPHAWSWFRFDGGLPRRIAIVTERVLARWTHRIVCGSHDEAAVGRANGVGADAIVIDNAVDTTRFAPADATERRRLKVELGLEPDAPVVVCVARLVPQKAHQVLLQAWRYVVAQRPDARLLLVGAGSRRDELQAWNVPNVEWYGARRDPELFHRLADVSVLSSKYETLALSMLEAMSCGSPVVVTAAQGAERAVCEGERPAAGDVVPLGDATALAHAILARIERGDDPTTRAAARARIVDHYGTDGWREAFRTLYDGLLGTQSTAHIVSDAPLVAPLSTSP